MSTTHTSLRTAIATVITGLTVGGYTLRATRTKDITSGYGTDYGCHAVAIGVDEAPGDEWGGVRAYVVTLSAAALVGCDEVAATDLCSTLARALRTAMLTTSGITDADAQVIDASDDSITREGDAVVLRQRYQISAPS